MNDVIAAVFGLLLRVVWVICGLVLLGSFMMAALLAALVLGVRYAWARLTGKPVKPFIFSSFRQGQGMSWGQFKSTADAWTTRATGPFGAKTTTKAKTSIHLTDVTDVESRPAKSSEPSS